MNIRTQSRAVHNESKSINEYKCIMILNVSEYLSVIYMLTESSGYFTGVFFRKVNILKLS